MQRYGLKMAPGEENGRDPYGEKEKERGNFGINYLIKRLPYEPSQDQN